MIIYNLTLDIIADMFGEFLAKIFGTKPAATDEKAVAKPAAIAPPSVATDENAVATDKKAVTNPAAATNVKAQVPQTLSSEAAVAAVAAGGQKGGSRRRRRRSCGKSKKGGAYSGMGFGHIGGKSRRRSKKRNTHKRRK